MIEPQTWVAGILGRLKEAFGSRLAYVGLQGSYQRGEATEDSDIDLVVLLDVVEPADLDLYRGIVQGMPEGHKACGFMCSIADFAAWPRHELFPFKMDTADHYGRLDDFLPPVSEDDIRLGVAISASETWSVSKVICSRFLDFSLQGIHLIRSTRQRHPPC